jgi:hypothetical protein
LWDDLWDDLCAIAALAALESAFSALGADFEGIGKAAADAAGGVGAAAGIGTGMAAPTVDGGVAWAGADAGVWLVAAVEMMASSAANERDLNMMMPTQ